jgi:hypothetical protein
MRKMIDESHENSCNIEGTSVVSMKNVADRSIYI